MNPTQDFDELMSQLWQLDDKDPQKLKIIERAIKLAEIEGDIDKQFKAKVRYVRITTFARLPEKTLSTFPWLLAMLEKYPDRFSSWDVMWKYKWVVDKLPFLTQLSYEQIEAAIQDFESCYEKHGYGKQTVYEYKRALYIDLGHEDKVRFYNDILEKDYANSSGSMNDCRACIRQREVRLAVFLKEYDKAFTLAEPITKGNMSCSSIPGETYDVLIPLCLKLGRVEELNKFGGKLLKENQKSKYSKELYPNFLLYCWANEKYPSALLFIEEFLNRSDYYELDKLKFYTNVAKVFGTMQAQGEKEVKLKLPESHVLCKGETQQPYLLSELHEWFLTESENLAQAFDKRNGNSYYRDYRNEILNLTF